VGVIIEYLRLWNILNDVELHQGVQDSHSWRFTSSGQFSVKSKYEDLFCGSVKFEPFERVWKAWARPSAGSLSG
jgi:hypothetical protein